MSSYCDLQWGMRAAEKDSSAFVKCTKNRDYFKQIKRYHDEATLL